MSVTECPIAYDHNDDLDCCEICGWTPEIEAPVYRNPYEGLPKWLWPDHMFAPTKPVRLCGGFETDDREPE